MYIVAEDSVSLLETKHILLEVDTITDPDTGTSKRFYCVIDQLPLQDLPMLDLQIRAHQQLISEYKNKNWEYCRQACYGLQGKWNGTLDSFYLSLIDRIDRITTQPQTQ